MHKSGFVPTAILFFTAHARLFRLRNPAPGTDRQASVRSRKSTSFLFGAASSVHIRSGEHVLAVPGTAGVQAEVLHGTAVAGQLAERPVRVVLFAVRPPDPFGLGGAGRKSADAVHQLLSVSAQPRESLKEGRSPHDVGALVVGESVRIRRLEAVSFNPVRGPWIAPAPVRNNALPAQRQRQSRRK